MTVSVCCGAAIIVETRSDDPHVYDDEYNLEIEVLICSVCRKVVGLDSLPNQIKE